MFRYVIFLLLCSVSPLVPQEQAERTIVVTDKDGKVIAELQNEATIQRMGSSRWSTMRANLSFSIKWQAE
jgi:hypothetical protein